MNRQLIQKTIGLFFLFILIYIAIVKYDDYLHDREELSLPNRISSYQNFGYYTFEPESILESLDHSEEVVFTPFFGDPNNIDEISELTISWTQEDFLIIAEAVGKPVWKDSMNLNDWEIYYIFFYGKCNDLAGLNFAKITYFDKMLKKGRYSYITRHIEIDPYIGLIRWGGEKPYPIPIVQKWNSVDLLGAKITSDDAQKIACEEAINRSQPKKPSGTIISSPHYNDEKNWHISIFGDPYFGNYKVNLMSGEFEIFEADH